jgi:alpha-D-ribose 1-methylphosphonate 5-triphosphate diphosphatase PhnM
MYGAGVALTQAVAMASTNPARLLRTIARQPIRVGANADLTLLRLRPEQAAVDAVATIVGGVVVHQLSDAPIGDRV